MRATCRSLAFAGATLFLAAGCISVQPLDGSYICAVDSDCPSNYVCEPSTLTCWQRGHSPSTGPDMSGATDDMDGGDSPECHDEVMNGSETDVDCGGSCAPCSTGHHCAANTDCTSMLCNTFTGLCVGTKCDNGTKDTAETDVDCGGGACVACADGKACKSNTDCMSNICNASSHICAGTLCADGVKDGAESDVDCGGTMCPHCLGGKSCDVNSDCLSGQCSTVTHTCAASACENGSKDPGETDTDCGGTSCSGCALSKACLSGTDCLSHFCNAVSLTCVGSQCLDGVKNGTETDTDCGGACGNNCKVGGVCKTAADCASGNCGANHTCVATQCQDGMKDGAETDKDCGGGTCLGCALSLSCLDGTRDCLSMFCNQMTKVCVADQCHDGAVDGSESDTDCGGPTCAHCTVNQGCKSGTDCTSTFCNKDSLKCVDSQCKDGFKDLGETDIDCGGGGTTGCAACGLGKGCGAADANCASGFCNFVTSVCVANACGDGRIDGAESDIDCGGGTCTTCDPGKICKLNTDCGSSACDFGPVPHKCITDGCADHHKDGSETDIDCGGGTCSLCALGKTCSQGSDCSSGYCDGTSHKCACGGVNQACCNGAQCTQASDLCSGTISCSTSNICVQSNAVTCPAAQNSCQVAGMCMSSSGTCSPTQLLTGPACNLAGTDQCIVANSSACANGQCAGGSKVPDRCVGNVAQTCNNNSWTTRTTCANGCGGDGVCNGPPAPTVSAVLDGTDVAVSWSAPGAGVTCTLLRNDNLGKGWQAPAAAVSPCPASVAQPCNAYDRALLRGSYNYELSCKDGSGATSTSAPFPATGALHPGTEICAGDWSIALEVHTGSPDNFHDKLERQMSVSASLASTVAVAYAGPSAADNTNCAPTDHTCGTVYVGSRDNDKVMAFDRRANDSDATSSGSQPPSASQRTLSISLKDSGVTKYQPMGVAVLGNTLIVALNAAPGFLAGYPLGFTNSTAQPNWYLRGLASAKNKLAQPLAVAVDNGTGIGGGYVFVANSASAGTTTITGYKLDEITNPTNVNSSNFVNDVVAPFVTITTSVKADSIAIDSANHVLYATQASNAGRIFEYSTQTGAFITSFQGKQITTPLGLAFSPASGGGGTVYVVDNVTGAILSFPAGSSGGPLDPIINFTVPSLKNNAAGLVICN